MHGNGIPIPMGIPWEYEHKYAKMRMRMGRVHVTMGMTTFACVPKFPLVDSMRMESNKML